MTSRLFSADMPGTTVVQPDETPLPPLPACGEREG
jgi:hypothetical protein